MPVSKPLAVVSLSERDPTRTCVVSSLTTAVAPSLANVPQEEAVPSVRSVNGGAAGTARSSRASRRGRCRGWYGRRRARAAEGFMAILEGEGGSDRWRGRAARGTRRQLAPDVGPARPTDSEAMAPAKTGQTSPRFAAPDGTPRGEPGPEGGPFPAGH